MGAIGRRNLVRVARYLTNTARLDVLNDMRLNGELLVQDTVLANFPADRELVVFDVGANLGEWSLQLLARSDLAKRSVGMLHAFEPVSSTMRILQENLRGINSSWKISPVQQALSNKHGHADIAVIEEGCGINSLIPDAKQPIKRKETVELATIDDYCEAHCVAEIALLKIDAEGHDLFVLRGASRLLSQKAINVVQFEYNFRWAFSRTTLLDAFEYAQSFDYRVGKVTPGGIEFYEHWDPELEKFVEGNYLICHPEWAGKFPQIRWWNLDR